MARAKAPRNGNTRTTKPLTAPAVTAPDGMANWSAVDVETEIRRRAYQLYEERGRTPGHENDDWLVAEREILARSNQQHSA
jgi:hypothetical protein